MTSIAHYNLLEQLGTPDLIDVHRARDTKVGRTVAIKVVSSALLTDPTVRARLLEESRAATQLSHPNIATLFEIGETDGHVYLVYEFAAGRTLRAELAGGPMHPRHAIDLAVQIADAVADAHAHGIVHGDLRPDTIIVTAKGSAKLLDYGLTPWTRGGVIRARAPHEPDALGPETIPVLAYLSPEQAIGGAVDPRTDIFSVATLAYEMLTGKNPFAAATATDTVINVIQGKVAPPSSVNPTVPADVDNILLQALAKNLDARQQSAAALAAELRSIGAVLDVRSGDTVQPSALLPLDETPDKSARGLFFGALAAAAAAAGIVWWWLNR